MVKFVSYQQEFNKLEERQGKEIKKSGGKQSEERPATMPCKHTSVEAEN